MQAAASRYVSSGVAGHAGLAAASSQVGSGGCL